MANTPAFKIMLTCIKILEMVVVVIDLSVVHICERTWTTMMKVIVDHIVSNITKKFSTTKCAENVPTTKLHFIIKFERKQSISAYQGRTLE